MLLDLIQLVTGSIEPPVTGYGVPTGTVWSVRKSRGRAWYDPGTGVPEISTYCITSDTSHLKTALEPFSRDHAHAPGFPLLTLKAV